MKAWKHRVFPPIHSCQQVLEITHPAPCRPRAADLWPDFLNNSTNLAFPVKPSRRFNSARWLMLAVVIEFPAKAQPASRRLLDVPWSPNNIVSSSLSIHHRPFGQIRAWTQRSRCLPLDKIPNNSLVGGKGGGLVLFCSWGKGGIVDMWLGKK